MHRLEKFLSPLSKFSRINVTHDSVECSLDYDRFVCLSYLSCLVMDKPHSGSFRTHDRLSRSHDIPIVSIENGGLLVPCQRRPAVA